MYEAGVAAGSLRPLVIIADPAVADDLPRQLISAPLIRYKVGSKELLRESLSTYIKQVLPIAAQVPSNWRPQLPGLSDTIHSRPTLDESTVAGQVAARLAQAGALVTSEAELPDNLRADIVATFPALGPEFNPILIETKSSAITPTRADIRQIRTYLQAAHARLGIIVYGHGKGRPTVNIYGSQGILRLSLNDLLGWDDERLIQEITRLRNQVVHSV
jgi:hypothetical protein